MKFDRTPISTGLDNSILLKYQPILSSYLPTGWTDYSTSINEAEYQILQKLKNEGKNLRKFCTPLTLEDSVSKTISFTGTKSAEDTINRMMWVVKTSAIGSSETFTLQGTDDDSIETYSNVVSTIQTSIGSTFTRIKNIYKYYRVNYSGTSATYETYLVEISFFFAHIYKTLELIYRLLSSSPGDDFWIKAGYYSNESDKEMNNMLASYDDDLSGGIDDTETQIKVGIVELVR